MRPYRALFFAIVAIFTTLAGGIAVQAQEAIPETPPELRDFRLDPERSQPQPTPQPTVTPPAVVNTVPETATGAAPARPRPARRQPTGPQPAANPEPETTASPQAEATLPTVEQAEPITPSETAPVATEAEPAVASWNYGLVAGIAAATLIGLLGLWFALKRRRRQRVELAFEKSATEPEAPKPAQPVVPKPVPAPNPVKASDRAPDIALAFVPEKATISFTTLTVKGQLQIANESQSLAQDMQFRAGLISASNEQQHAMDAFFGDSGISANALGEAKPGEKRAMSIELTVPLTEMHSFPVGDQRLLVPIMVAELAYKSEGGTDRQVRIASMLGREAKPPQPKMGPLRLDQGPRSFAPLGQRPLAA